jgi:hypothetical protein
MVNRILSALCFVLARGMRRPAIHKWNNVKFFMVLENFIGKSMYSYV